MFDHVHIGWLESDDYRVAAQAAGVVELPDGPEPGRDDADLPCGPPAEPREPARSVLADLPGGWWVDGHPGSVGK